MKCNFLYDEGDSKPYESIQDWYNEIKHLMIPTIMMIFLGAAVFIYFKYFNY